MDPLASVIIPAFNMQSCIGAAVQSALSQDISDIEIVIASDDGLDYLAILAEQNICDSRLRCELTGCHGGGAAKARNTALKAARGRLIVVLDADDLLKPQALKKILPLALCHGAAYSSIERVRFSDGLALSNCNRVLPQGLLGLEDILTSSIQNMAWLAFDRSRVPDLNYLETIPVWEDLVFLAQCCDRLGKIYYLPDQLYIYRQREGSLCNRPEAAHEFYDWAQHLLKLLIAQDSILQCSLDTRSILIRFFKHRCFVEQQFVAAMAEQRYSDYLDFMRQNLDLFYSLPA